MRDQPSVVTRLVKGFGRFWWDFLVGDTPELFIAALVIIAVTALLSESRSLQRGGHRRLARARRRGARGVTGARGSLLATKVNYAAGSS